MQKKISSLVICSCLALAICVSAVVSADTSGTETSGDKITFEQYLVALYNNKLFLTLSGCRHYKIFRLLSGIFL